MHVARKMRGSGRDEGKGRAASRGSSRITTLVIVILCMNQILLVTYLMSIGNVEYKDSVSELSNTKSNEGGGRAGSVTANSNAEVMQCDCTQDVSVAICEAGSTRREGADDYCKDVQSAVDDVVGAMFEQQRVLAYALAQLQQQHVTAGVPISKREQSRCPVLHQHLPPPNEYNSGRVSIPSVRNRDRAKEMLEERNANNKRVHRSKLLHTSNRENVEKGRIGESVGHETVLRVETMNLRNVEEPWLARKKIVVDHLLVTKPDVVCLQEVRVHDSGGGLNQAEEIQAELRTLYPYVYYEKVHA